MSEYTERIFRISYLLRRILVAYDGSNNSEKGLDIALELSRNLGSEIVVVHACPKGACDKRILDNVERKAREKGLSLVTKLLVYDPSKSSVSSEIVKEINNGNYDLVIMGVRGTSVSEDINIGSIPASVFINTHTSYLFVR